MRYVSWAAFYEGASDGFYLDILLPRVLGDMIEKKGRYTTEVPDYPAVKFGRNGRSIEKVSEEVGEFQDAFEIVFVHADTGGRALESRIENRADAYCQVMKKVCNWKVEKCITITPRHETEAWLLADGQAITSALGYTGAPVEVGLPQDARAAEKITDPKKVLGEAVRAITGRRREADIKTLYPAIASRQRLEHLRSAKSFSAFEDRLRFCLIDLNVIN